MSTFTPQVLQDGRTVYNFHRFRSPLPSLPSSAIICLCSLDTRVASYAASLFLRGVAPILVFSGNTGILTQDRFDKPEAEVFADIAVDMGVPRDKILLESRSRNTGENVRFTRQMLKEKGVDLTHGRLVLVQKPYMEQRTWATFMKQWPQPGDAPADKVEIIVSGPPYEFEEYPNEDNPMELVINLMVGDLIRLRTYAKLGFQVEVEVPEDVWEAAQRLIEAGFNKHLPES